MARGRSPGGDDMLAGQCRGYLQQSQDQLRRTGKVVADGRRGMVDRAAYMSFLESQLERVTASCQTVERYNSRIDSIQDAMAATETRVANNTRLVNIAQSFGEQVEDDMKKFKHVYTTKFQRLDESVSSVLDIHQKMLDRVEALERIADRTDKSIQQVEERVAFSLSKHSLHTEEMVGAMEERVMMMLRGHKEEMQSSIDRAARETREMLSSVTEGRREELLERERFQQCVLQESRRQSDEWEALNNDVRRRVDDMEARSMHTIYEAIAKTDAAVGRVHADVRDVEARLAAEVRQAVEEIKDAEQRLARGVDASMQPLASTARDLEIVRRDVVRLDTERLKMKDLLLSKMTDIDRRMGAYGGGAGYGGGGGGHGGGGGIPEGGGGEGAGRLSGGMGWGGKTVRIDDGKGRIEATRTDTSSSRGHGQLHGMEADLRKRVDDGLDKVKQLLDKSTTHMPHAQPSAHNHPASFSAGAGGRGTTGTGDRLGAALIGLEAGAASHFESKVSHHEARPALREPLRDTLREPFSLNAGGGSTGRGVAGVGKGVGAGSGGKWLLNPEGIGDNIHAAVKDLEGKSGGGGGGGRPVRSPSPLSDTNDGGASLEERKERRRKRLKELYKELTSLEVEESSFRKI